MISAGTTAGVGTDVADAAADGIGNVYVDDEAEPPGYATLPAFWLAELADADPGHRAAAGLSRRGQPAARMRRWDRYPMPYPVGWPL